MLKPYFDHIRKHPVRKIQRLAPRAFHVAKEFGEGFDRICREQEANGANVPSFRTDEFILKITVPKVAVRVDVNVTEKGMPQKTSLMCHRKRHRKRHRKLWT